VTVSYTAWLSHWCPTPGESSKRFYGQLVIDYHHPEWVFRPSSSITGDPVPILMGLHSVSTLGTILNLLCCLHMGWKMKLQVRVMGCIMLPGVPFSIIHLSNPQTHGYSMFQIPQVDSQECGNWQSFMIYCSVVDSDGPRICHDSRAWWEESMSRCQRDTSSPSLPPCLYPHVGTYIPGPPGPPTIPNKLGHQLVVQPCYSLSYWFLVHTFELFNLTLMHRPLCILPF